MKGWTSMLIYFGGFFWLNISNHILGFWDSLVWPWYFGRYIVQHWLAI